MGFTTHFYGQEISDYGREHGYVDYHALAKAFEGVLNNNIVERMGWENWETENGSLEYYEYDGDSYTYDELCELREELENEQEELDEDSERYQEIEEALAEIDDAFGNPNYEEVYQWYIIDCNGVDILKEFTNDIVLYNEELDMYVWGVTHYGTSWKYVLTDIKLDKEEKNA